MIDKIIKFYRRLAVKLILLISIAILPVNILALTVTQIIINDYQTRLINSYSSELDLYMAQVDAQLSDIEEAAVYFISNHIGGLTIGYDPGLASVNETSLYSDFRDMKSRLDLAAIGFLKNNKTGDTLITTAFADGGGLLPDLAVKAKIIIEEADFSILPEQQYGIQMIGDRIFQVNSYSFNTYSFGFLIDTQVLLGDLFSMRTTDREIDYLAHRDGRLAAYITESERVVLPVDKSKPFDLDALRSQNSQNLIEAQSSKMDYSLVRVLDESDVASKIPLTDRILQAVAFLSFLIIPVSWLLVRQLVLRPMNQLSTAMHEIEGGNLEYKLPQQASSEDFKYMNEAFNRMAAEIKTLTIEAYETDIEKLEIESMNLRLQVNPHMLLNAFNMIFSLAQSKNYKSIQKFSRHLSDYFRYALRQNDRLVALRDEMKFVLSYLEVQKIRFPGAFTSVYSIDDGLEAELLPPLLIQNFVENSIKYALKLGSTIEIVIIVRKNSGRLTISICDTGNGIAPDKLDKIRAGTVILDNTGQHIGIWNIRRRLKLFYGEKAVLKISSAIGQGTQVWIELPSSQHAEQTSQGGNDDEPSDR